MIEISGFSAKLMDLEASLKTGLQEALKRGGE